MTDSPLFDMGGNEAVAGERAVVEAKRVISSVMERVASDLDKARNALQGGGTLLEMRQWVSVATHFDELYRALADARDSIGREESP